MAEDTFDKYLSEINKAYLKGNATEHTHRPALKVLIETLGKNITATNEPRQIACGAPDILVSSRKGNLDLRIGYIECKDIGVDLKKEEKSEQIKKRYLPSLHNFILTDYIEFRWYTNGELRETATLAREGKGGAFEATEKGKQEIAELLRTFLEHEPEKITSAKELAIRMGHMAQLLRDVTVKTFEQEEEKGALHNQLEAFREVLIHDLKKEQFADMYAQTICYGLFTAACCIEDITIFGEDKYARFHGMKGKPGEFTRKDAAYLLPKTNPFLRKLFGHIAGPDLDDRIAWLVDDVVSLLRECRMEVILRDFARKKDRRDPVVHFYETFLAEYDPKLRKSRGVYYTPDPVVSYIVRSVDWILKGKFGLKRGIADESKIKTGEKECHRVLILDPAVGTGTFLFEAIDLIHSKFEQQKGMWSGYVRDHLLPRLFGFELQMAPYAICHMKLGLELAETGYDFGSDERVGVYLTNTLEEAEKTSKALFAQWLSEEAIAASEVKRDLPIMVVVGNPPYAGISANRGEWITKLVEEYKKIDGKDLGEKKIWIKNDYVKFIRFGQRRIEQTGQGILAFITDHSYLDSPTFRGMRYHLLNCFDEIYILNLHGNSKRREITPHGEKDENVFDITQGTAINIFVKKQEKGKKARVFYGDIWGKREDKYDKLMNIDLTDYDKEIDPSAPFYQFIPVNEEDQEEYKSGEKVSDIFAIGSNGVQTSRDGLVVDFERELLKERIEDFISLSKSEDEVREKYFGRKNSDKYAPGDTRGWILGEARIKLRNDAEWKDRISKYAYRPFDERFVLYSSIMVDWPRAEIMSHLAKTNRALCVGRAGLVASGGWDIVFCVGAICDHNLFYRGSSMNFPLYLYPGTVNQKVWDLADWAISKEDRIPNIKRKFVEELGRRVGMTFVCEGNGDLEGTFGPEDVFDYIYGVFHSPEYRIRYAEFLKIDFPRVPWPKNREIFRKVREVGGQLVRLHSMKADILEEADQMVLFDVEGNGVIEEGYPKYIANSDKPEQGKIYINKDQFFEGVRPDVWEFLIGGYQVCEKWLKDRRGRKLSYDDIRHYQKTVVALGETIRLMGDKCLFEMFEGRD
ncbi:MAG: type ISP restriction/modification enzyme [Sedimentisphaerales bacterium]